MKAKRIQDLMKFKIADLVGDNVMNPQRKKLTPYQKELMEFLAACKYSRDVQGILYCARLMDEEEIGWFVAANPQEYAEYELFTNEVFAGLHNEKLGLPPLPTIRPREDGKLMEGK
jgi:hypothetical protein